MIFEDFLSDMPRLHSWDGGKTWTTGGFDSHHLKSLYGFLRDKLHPEPVFLETGAGNSTITMLFLRPARLISIAPDAGLFERIRQFCLRNEIPDAPLEVHVEKSQWVLPQLAAENRNAEPMIDFALIDGCHGWPTAFVDLEYTNAMLRQDGFLMIDDVQLHSIKEMARLLSEHPDFSLELDIGKSLVFRKISPQRDLSEWVRQPYIVRRTNEHLRLPNPNALAEPNPVTLALRRVARTLNRPFNHPPARSKPAG